MSGQEPQERSALEPFLAVRACSSQPGLTSLRDTSLYFMAAGTHGREVSEAKTSFCGRSLRSPIRQMFVECLLTPRPVLGAGHQQCCSMPQGGPRYGNKRGEQDGNTGAGHVAVFSTPRIDLIQKAVFVQRPIHTRVSSAEQGPSIGKSWVRSWCRGSRVRWVARGPARRGRCMQSLPHGPGPC